MPETEVVLFAEADGSSPLIDWLDRLPSKVQNIHTRSKKVAKKEIE